MLTSKSHSKASASVLILLFAAGLLVGGLAIYYVTYQQVNSLNGQVTNLQSRVSNLEGFQNATYQSITIMQNGTSLADMYANVRNSVVLIQGETSDGGVQGSGFVYNFAGRTVVLTNYHVVQGTTSLSVTFSDGNGYSATVLGNRPVLGFSGCFRYNAPASEFKPVTNRKFLHAAGG